MTAIVSIIVGVAALACVVLAALWRKELAARKQAERRAELQAIRADAAVQLRKQLQASEAAWRQKHEALQRKEAQARAEAAGARAEIESVMDDPAALSEHLNRVFGHDME